MHKMHLRRQVTKKRLAILAILVLASGLLLFNLTWQISIQTPDARSARDAAVYSKLLNEYYATRPFERLRFFLSHKDLHEYFLRHAPEVKSIRIEGDFFARSAVKLVFRQPVAEWTSGDKSYFVDDGGVTFEKNYFDAPSVSVRDDSGIPAQGGQEVINRQFLSFLGQAVAAFSQNNARVTEAVLPANSIRQVWFRLDGKSYYIKTTVDRSAQAQVKQAVLTINYLAKQGRVPNYIDVRVDQRSFYR